LGASYPALRSDVQDKKILAELQSFGLKRKYAAHITQAACNDCAVFLTRDRKIIRRRGPKIKILKIKILRPSELVAQLNSIRKIAG